MIEINEIRNKYNYLYESLRKYTWDFNTIQALADLEIQTYTAFPDIDSLKSSLSRLKINIIDIYREDDDIKSAFDDFESTLNNSEEVYVKLGQVQEVIR